MSTSTNCSTTRDRQLTAECCSIPKTEERGITRAQLREVYALVEQESAGWCAAEQHPESGEWRLGGKLLDLPPECINLYHVNDNLIKLKTEPFKCSYVELVSTAAQPPLWFVSQ